LRLLRDLHFGVATLLLARFHVRGSERRTPRSFAFDSPGFSQGRPLQRPFEAPSAEYLHKADNAALSQKSQRRIGRTA
jgi:hypothetical protein